MPAITIIAALALGAHSPALAEDKATEGAAEQSACGKCQSKASCGGKK